MCTDCATQQEDRGTPINISTCMPRSAGMCDLDSGVCSLSFCPGGALESFSACANLDGVPAPGGCPDGAPSFSPRQISGFHFSQQKEMIAEHQCTLHQGCCQPRCNRYSQLPPSA